MKVRKFPCEILFEFTEYLEMQKEKKQTDLGLFLELAEETKVKYNQVPVNTLIEDNGKLKKAFLRLVSLL